MDSRLPVSFAADKVCNTTGRVVSLVHDVRHYTVFYINPLIPERQAREHPVQCDGHRSGGISGAVESMWFTVFVAIIVSFV